MSKKEKISTSPESIVGVTDDSSSADVTAAAGESERVADVNVAYFDGPSSMGYFKRRWVRGVAQPVSAEDWNAMQQRTDCAPHDFRVV